MTGSVPNWVDNVQTQMLARADTHVQHGLCLTVGIVCHRYLFVGLTFSIELLVCGSAVGHYHRTMLSREFS